MASYRTTQVYTEMKNRPRTVSPRKIETDNERGQGDPICPPDRNIRVTAVGEVSLPPDRCRIVIEIISKKESPQDAKNSVSRRLDYIMQTLQNHTVKVSINNNTNTISNSITRVFCFCLLKNTLICF